jgi:type VI secretion system protein ImpA
MPIIDVEALTGPVSAEAPCGPDLELEGNAEYMNFLARAESVLPASFFSGRDESGNTGRPFDRSSIDFDGQFEAAKPLLAKTRDLRLLTLLARFCALNRDLESFEVILRAIAVLLKERWHDVHPRGEDGDFALRMVALESLDDSPTVIMPLQFAPLIESRRVGPISLRSYLITKGEVKPRDDEAAIDLASLEQALAETELSALVEKRRLFESIETALGTIVRASIEHGGPGSAVNLEKLSSSASRIFSWFNDVVAKRDPKAAATPLPAGDEGALAPTPSSIAAEGMGSAAEAVAALAAVADYFSRFEPSNPALLLVRQAAELPGKSFLEVMRILIPGHVEQASVGIGKEHFFELPVERLSKFADGNSAGEASNSGEVSCAGNEAGSFANAFPVKSRADALALLERVGAYFRSAEPSSPIPFLIERARDLAQRDFLSVLKALLPENALKSLDPGS